MRHFSPICSIGLLGAFFLLLGVTGCSSGSGPGLGPAGLLRTWQKKSYKYNGTTYVLGYKETLTFYSNGTFQEYSEKYINEPTTRTDTYFVNGNNLTMNSTSGNLVIGFPYTYTASNTTLTLRGSSTMTYVAVNGTGGSGGGTYSGLHADWVHRLLSRYETSTHHTLDYSATAQAPALDGETYADFYLAAAFTCAWAAEASARAGHADNALASANAMYQNLQLTQAAMSTGFSSPYRLSYLFSPSDTL